MARRDVPKLTAVIPVFLLGIVACARAASEGNAISRNSEALVESNLKTVSVAEEVTRWHIGILSCPTSTEHAEAQALLEEGLKFLHNFNFEMASRRFKKARSLDPTFQMAYVGEALSHHQGFWGRFRASEGYEVLGRLQTVRSQTREPISHREELYVLAVYNLYNWPKYLTTNEERLNASYNFYASMKTLHQEYPEDDEAATFYVLSMLMIAFPYQRGYVERIQPYYDDLWQTILAVLNRNPHHPGALHYAVHLSDNPTDALAGLPYGELYSDVARSSPHAVHMVSHLHLRLGMWEEAVVSNERAMYVSERMAKKDLHNLEFLHYCYLQTGWYNKAYALEESMMRLAIEAEQETEGSVDEYLRFRANTMRGRSVVDFGFVTGSWEFVTHELLEVNCPGCFLDHMDSLQLWMTETTAIYFFVEGVVSAMNGDEQGYLLWLEQLKNVADVVFLAPEYPWYMQRSHLRVVLLQLQAVADKYLYNGQLWRELMGQAVAIETASDPPGYDPIIPIKPSLELYATLLWDDEPSMENAQMIIRLLNSLQESSPLRLASVSLLAKAHSKLRQMDDAYGYYSKLTQVDKTLYKLREEAREYVSMYESVRAASFPILVIAVASTLTFWRVFGSSGCYVLGSLKLVGAVILSIFVGHIASTPVWDSNSPITLMIWGGLLTTTALQIFATVIVYAMYRKCKCCSRPMLIALILCYSSTWIALGALPVQTTVSMVKERVVELASTIVMILHVRSIFGTTSVTRCQNPVNESTRQPYDAVGTLEPTDQ